MERQWSKAALAALILAISGLCLLPLALVAVGLAVAGLVYVRRDPRLSGRALAILALVIVPVDVAVWAGIAVLAVPNLKHAKEERKAFEARAQLHALYEAASHQRSSGHSLSPLPRTPARVPCGTEEAWPSDAAAGWAALGFRPSTVRFSYELVTGPDAHFVLRAVGDLDCDGVTSLYEMDENGELRVERALE